MTDDHHGLGPTRTRVLSLLQSSAGPLTIMEIAGQLGLHKNSARFHLDALVDAGYAHRAKDVRGVQGRPPMIYTATAAAPTLNNLHLIELAEVLIDAFVQPAADGLERAEEAGRAWGRRPERTESTDGDAVVTDFSSLMAQRGFTIERSEEGLLFTRCPFRDIMSAEQLPVVCRLHQGMASSYVEGTPVVAGPIRIGEHVCVLPLEVTRPSVLAG